MATRIYETDEIIVHWDSSRCIHSGICLGSLPEVFDTEARPWVNVTGAAAAAIAATIEKCPSGALAYSRPDGSTERAEVPTTIVPEPNGPLWVRGEVEVRDVDGNVFRAGPRMTLCRCGHSRNQPFCDLSHRGAGFRDNPRVVTEARSGAEDPTAVGD